MPYDIEDEIEEMSEFHRGEAEKEAKLAAELEAEEKLQEQLIASAIHKQGGLLIGRLTKDELEAVKYRIEYLQWIISDKSEEY